MKPWVTEMKPLPIEVPKEPTDGEFMSGAEVEAIKAYLRWPDDGEGNYGEVLDSLRKRLGVEVPK